MKIYSVGDLKANFSAVMDAVRHGEEVAVSYGRKKETVAVIVPYHAEKSGEKRKLGLLKGRGVCIIRKDFAVTDEELAG